MNNTEKFQIALAGRVIPVVVMENADRAEPLAEALLAAGMRCAEVTFRTEAAAEAIKRMSAFDELIVGAGTVLNPAQAAQAIEAGAGFVVTPGLSAGVVKYCQEHEVPVTPGVATASEIMTALDLGVDLLKFFPAGNLGGPKTLKALCGPFRQVRFIPTGGVNAGNLADYLALPQVAAVGGSWMVKAALLNENKWDEVRRLTAEALENAK
jgi:2-dehydro-3-deoxyphosphogluconate aldolase/(4S)-4-hydroxy-2-oxoglutarate aldolase